MGGGITSRFDWAFDRMRCENEQVIFSHHLVSSGWYKLPWEPNQEDILALDWVKFPYGV